MYNLGSLNVFKSKECNYAYATSDNSLRQYFDLENLGTSSDIGISTGSN